jgi:TonB family protein
MMQIELVVVAAVLMLNWQGVAGDAGGADNTPADPLPSSTWLHPPANMTPPKHDFDPGVSIANVMHLSHRGCPDNWAFTDVTVAADGSVTNVEVLQSSGSADIDAAYIKDLTGWHFTPATVDGHPVAAKKEEVLALVLFRHPCPNGGAMQVPGAEDRMRARLRGH